MTVAVTTRAAEGTQQIALDPPVSVSVIYNVGAAVCTKGTVDPDHVYVEDSLGLTGLSEASFAEDWNSPADSIYDDDHPE